MLNTIKSYQTTCFKPCFLELEQKNSEIMFFPSYCVFSVCCFENEWYNVKMTNGLISDGYNDKIFHQLVIRLGVS